MRAISLGTYYGGHSAARALSELKTFSSTREVPKSQNHTPSHAGEKLGWGTANVLEARPLPPRVPVSGAHRLRRQTQPL